MAEGWGGVWLGMTGWGAGEVELQMTPGSWLVGESARVDANGVGCIGRGEMEVELSSR